MRPRDQIPPVADRPETRIGRRTIERRFPGERWRDVRMVAVVALLWLVGTAWFLWLLIGLVAPSTGGPGAALRGGTASTDPVDIDVRNVIAGLPDGRAARGWFTLRLREDAGVARPIATPRATPTPERLGKPQPPPRVDALEALLRERVNEAMAGLSYEEIKGEAGKQRLKEAVREAVNAGLEGAPVDQVYIREYLVQ